MIKRVAIICAGIALAAGSAAADQMRTQLTKENKFPELHQAELGLDLQYNEKDDEDEAFITTDVNATKLEPFVRYRAFENVSVLARVPFLSTDPDVGMEEDGIGDVSLGAELKAYEHIFSYPYIIPHATVTFDTGDEKKGLGRGESSVTLGLTVGTVSWETWTFNADVSYAVFDNSENVFTLAGSVIWDLSREFSLLVEASISDEEIKPNDSHPALYLGGLSYHPYDRFAFTVYGGGGNHTDRDVTVGVKATYDL